MEVSATSCCGVGDVHGLCYNNLNAKQFLLSLAQEKYAGSDSDFPFYMLTCPNKHGHGTRVKAYVSRYKLGSCVKAPTKRNPHSGNRLDVFIFAPNEKNFYAFYRKGRHLVEENDW